MLLNPFATLGLPFNGSLKEHVATAMQAYREDLALVEGALADET